jgi:uncharacterized protein YcbX
MHRSKIAIVWSACYEEEKASSAYRAKPASDRPWHSTVLYWLPLTETENKESEGSSLYFVDVQDAAVKVWGSDGSHRGERQRPGSVLKKISGSETRMNGGWL